MMAHPWYKWHKNALNVAAVLLSLLSSIDYDNARASESMAWINSIRDVGKFESIVTPADPTFFLFQIVVMFNVAFGVVQLLPAHNKNEILQDGVDYNFFLAVMSQIVASIFFSFDSFMGNVVCTIFVGIMVVLYHKILHNQANLSVEPRRHSPEQYWLLRFPFSLSAGWFLCLLVTCINNLLVKSWFFGHPLFQLIFAIVCFVFYAGLSVKFLLYNGDRTPNYVIPGIISIFTLGIAFDFQGPGVEDNFNAAVIIFLMILASVVSIGIGFTTAYLLYNNEIKPYQGEDSEEDGEYQGAEMATTNSAQKTDDAGSGVVV